MNKTEIADTVKEITADILEVDISSLSDDTNLVKDLGAESLDLVDLVVALETEFDSEIADEDLASLQTISDIVNYIDAHLS